MIKCYFCGKEVGNGTGITQSRDCKVIGYWCCDEHLTFDNIRRLGLMEGKRVERERIIKIIQDYFNCKEGHSCCNSIEEHLIKEILKGLGSDKDK